MSLQISGGEVISREVIYGTPSSSSPSKKRNRTDGKQEEEPDSLLCETPPQTDYSFSETERSEINSELEALIQHQDLPLAARDLLKKASKEIATCAQHIVSQQQQAEIFAQGTLPKSLTHKPQRVQIAGAEPQALSHIHVLMASIMNEAHAQQCAILVAALSDITAATRQKVQTILDGVYNSLHNAVQVSNFVDCAETDKTLERIRTQTLRAITFIRDTWFPYQISLKRHLKVMKTLSNAISSQNNKRVEHRLLQQVENPTQQIRDLIRDTVQKEMSKQHEKQGKGKGRPQQHHQRGGRRSNNVVQKKKNTRKKNN